jgi:hypothetical protein
MITTITTDHKKRFEEIRKNLGLIGCKESSFLKVELLFYEALTISRSYGNDPEQNSLLAALKKVESDEYEKTKEKFRKSSQRETFIRRFVVQFKNVLAGKSVFSFHNHSFV